MAITFRRRAPRAVPPATEVTPPDGRFVLGHVAALDGLRGVAVVIVMGVHCTPILLKGGWTGVTIFFVLSGFLVTTLLLQEHDRRGTVNLGGFLYRRVRRLCPALFAFCAVAAVVHRILRTNLTSLAALPR